MNWLSENWSSLLLVAGVFLLMSRMGGCGMGRSSHHRDDAGERDAKTLPAPRGDPGERFDPGSRHRFTPGSNPVASIYPGRAYHFETRENRDAFELDPEKHLAGISGMGEPVVSDRGKAPHRHHHHGC